MTSFDMTETIVPKSDQLNADDMLTGPRTFTIAEVRRGDSLEQPVGFILAEFDTGRPYKPSKSMRRVMVAAWGKDASAYVGRRLTLYRDPEVRFAGQAVGGIKISHLSHLDKPMKLALTETKGKRAPYVVQPLADAPAPAKTPDYVADAKAAQSLAEWRAVWQRAKDAGHLTDALKTRLTPLGEALKEPVAEPDDRPLDWPDVAGPGSAARVGSAAEPEPTR